MNDAPTPPSETLTDPHAGHGAWARGVIERHVAVEEQLAQAGLRLALAIEQGATQAVAEGRPVEKTPPWLSPAWRERCAWAGCCRPG